LSPALFTKSVSTTLRTIFNTNSSTSSVCAIQSPSTVALRNHRCFAYALGMPRVLLNFQHYKDLWSVHFIQADCKTLIGPPSRYYDFATVDDLRAFVQRCNIEDMDDFEKSLRAWARGSNYVNLTDEQYAKLKR
jgi:hypothetical protein